MVLHSIVNIQRLKLWTVSSPFTYEEVGRRLSPTDVFTTAGEYPEGEGGGGLINTSVGPHSQKLSDLVVFPSWYPSYFPSLKQHAHSLPGNFRTFSCCTLSWAHSDILQTVYQGASRNMSAATVTDFSEHPEHYRKTLWTSVHVWKQRESGWSEWSDCLRDGQVDRYRHSRLMYTR